MHVYFSAKIPSIDVNVCVVNKNQVEDDSTKYNFLFFSYLNWEMYGFFPSCILKLTHVFVIFILDRYCDESSNQSWDMYTMPFFLYLFPYDYALSTSADNDYSQLLITHWRSFSTDVITKVHVRITSSFFLFLRNSVVVANALYIKAILPSVCFYFYKFYTTIYLIFILLPFN